MVPEKLKRDFARLIVTKGLNLQKGQRLVINGAVECADFVRLCAEEAYALGCREVLPLWRDDAITRLRYLYADSDVFDTVEEWSKLQKNGFAKEGCAWLSIHAEDPENLKGVDPDRINRQQMASGQAFAEFLRLETRNEFPWCVVSVPCVKWAQAVFPDKTPEDAVDALWEQILNACRVSGGNAVEDWSAHTAQIQRHVQQLNELNFKSLHYKNSLGTDFTVDLPEGHFWAGGEEKSSKGLPFCANIPTEEVFTLPVKNSGNGTLVSSRPLCINGNVIENFRFTVENGKIVSVSAEKGEDILKDAIALDEGASYFGELALVPCDSPISNSGVLFLNTLFDENASCHIAFGEAYPCIRGAENLSEEQLKELGVNFSMTHEDFMIGTPDLSITGITHDGRELPVFINGNFAF